MTGAAQGVRGACGWRAQNGLFMELFESNVFYIIDLMARGE